MGSKWQTTNNPQTTRRLVRLLILPILISIGFIFSISAIAFADTAPDTLKIHSAVVSKNLAENGDMLVAAHYEVAWDATEDYPTEPIDDYILCQMMTTTGSYTYAAVSPYPFVDDGYGEGVVSFYFTSDQVDILGLEWLQNYMIRITTKLGWVAPVEKYDYTLSDTDYCPSEYTSNNRLWLKQWVLDTAQSLETNWGLTASLTTVSIESVLSEYGEMYFLQAIPGLRFLCPDLFTYTLFCPDVPSGSGTPTLAEDLKDRGEYDGTIVESGLDTLASIFGSEIVGLNLIAIGLIGLLMGLSYWQLQNTRPGMILGLYTLPIGAELHFTELVVVGFIGILFTLFTAKILFWDKG